MSVPSNFLQNLSIVIGKEPMPKQVEWGEAMWYLLTPEEKRRDDVYLIIVQGLKLLNALHLQTVQDCGFQEGFARLKELAPMDLKKRNAHLMVIKKPTLLFKKAKVALKDCKLLYQEDNLPDARVPEEVLILSLKKVISSIGAWVRHVKKEMNTLSRDQLYIFIQEQEPNLNTLISSWVTVRINLYYKPIDDIDIDTWQQSLLKFQRELINLEIDAMDIDIKKKK